MLPEPDHNTINLSNIFTAIWVIINDFFPRQKHQKRSIGKILCPLMGKVIALEEMYILISGNYIKQ